MTTEKTEKPSDKNKDLNLAIQSITKAYGSGSIMRMGNASCVKQIEVIPTNSVSLDIALGVGGIPRGRIIEIYGPESSGKTTLMLHLIANAQKAGGVAAFIDAEHALDAKYAKALGVNLNELLVSQPGSGEEALTICQMLIESKALSIIVIDSVAALVPQAELDGEMGKATMGMQARLMSQALRKITAMVHKANTVVAFTNQLREKVGVMFGNPETTPGGKALKFYASVRLDIRRKEAIKDDNDAVMGNHTKVKVVKNKVAPPFCEAEFDIVYGQGINREADILDVAVTDGIVDKKGAWFQYEGQLIGQGRDATATGLKQKPELAEAIHKAIIAKRIKTEHVEPMDPEIPEAEEVEKEIISQESKEITALIEAGIKSGAITREGGGWLKYKQGEDMRTLGQSVEDVTQKLLEQPEMLADLHELLAQPV